jgi:hypothetical protein
MTQCAICEKDFSVIHWHHTIPRSRGGEDSLQIPLDATCHNTLHINALHIVSQINNPKRKKKKITFWKNYEDEQRADKYLQILVAALLRPIPEGLEREHLISISVPTHKFELFKLLQLDLALSSQEKTLQYCIESVIQSRGLDNEKNSKKEEPADLWFLLRPGT